MQTTGTSKLTGFNDYRQTAVEKPLAHNTLLQNDSDDDEDLRLFANDNTEGMFNDIQLDKMSEDLTRHIHLLKYADLSKRVDSLVCLNEMIAGMSPYNAPVLMRSANEMIGAFSHVMMEIFDMKAEAINLRFCKYFISIVLKACCCRDIMMQVS